MNCCCKTGFALLCLVATLAAEERRLTDDGRFKQDTVFVGPTGNELVFVVQETPEVLRRMRLNLADKQLKVAAEEAKRSEFEPAYSIDGRTEVFLQNRGNLVVGMVIRNVDGTEAAELPLKGGFYGVRSPCFIPGTNRLAFADAGDGRQQLWTVNRQGVDRKMLLDVAGFANWPTYSADGKTLVFSCSHEGNYEVYAAAPDGTQLRRLTDSPRQDIRPRISPDGQRVVFTSNRDGNYELYVMQSDGSGLTRLTNQPERDDYAAWHPDGKQMAYISERSGQFDLFLVDVPPPAK